MFIIVYCRIMAERQDMWSGWFDFEIKNINSRDPVRLDLVIKHEKSGYEDDNSISSSLSTLHPDYFMHKLVLSLFIIISCNFKR